MTRPLGRTRDGDGAIRVLHVDDEPDFLEVASTLIERENERFTVATATSAVDGLERLAADPFDCVISDYEMPSTNGIEFLEAVRETHPELPFILFTGRGSEEIASEAISAGVTDYLQKRRESSQYTVLANRISNVVEQHRSRQAISETEQKLSQLAEHTDDILYMFDGDWRELLFINSAYEEIWGGSIEELRADPRVFLEYVHPDDRERARASMGRILEGEPVETEYRVVPSDGDQRWVHGKTKPIRDDEGAINRIVGYVRDITDRKAREQELRRSERRYRAMFHDPNILVGSIDTDGTVLDINETAMEYVEASRADVIGDPFWQTPWFTRSEAVRRRVREWIDRAAEGEYVEFEADLERSDGTPFTVEGVFRPVTNAEGEVVSLLISDRDITEEKTRQRDLERTNALLSTLFEAMPQAVLAEDASREVLACNQRLIDLFEMSGDRDALIGTDCEDLAREAGDLFDDPAGFLERINTVVDRRDAVDKEELRLSDGRTFERSYRPIELPDGGGHLWVYTDMTDRLAYLATVNELQRRTEELVASRTETAAAETAVAIAETTLGFRLSGVHLVDGTGDRLEPIAVTEGAIEEIGRAPVYDRGDPSRQVDEFIWEIFERGEPIHSKNVEHTDGISIEETPARSGIVHPLGEHGVFVTTEAERDAFDDEDVHLVELLSTILTAVLDRIQREEDLRDQTSLLETKTQRLEEFTRVLSHDLRSPLTAAKGRLSLAREESNSEHLVYAEQSIDRMEELIGDLLALSRDGAAVTDPEPVDLGEVVEQCWRTVGSSDASLEVEVAHTIQGDPTRLKQVFENLFRNAIKHGGPAVTVTVGELEGGFYVADDGDGIPADAREEVFEAGYSAEDGGTGFGLTIVKEIVRAHGWEIHVMEGADAGARFEITGIEPGG